jgi:hypothetical protein
MGKYTWIVVLVCVILVALTLIKCSNSPEAEEKTESKSEQHSESGKTSSDSDSQADAAAEAKRLGIALNPQDVQPTLGTRALSTVAGERGMEAIANANKNQIRKVVLGELDLPLTTQLDSKAAFDQARMKVAAVFL